MLNMFGTSTDNLVLFLAGKRVKRVIFPSFYILLALITWSCNQTQEQRDATAASNSVLAQREHALSVANAATIASQLPGQQPLQITIREVNGKRIADNGYVTYEISGDPQKDKTAYEGAKERLLQENPEKYREMILREPVIPNTPVSPPVAQ